MVFYSYGTLHSTCHSDGIACVPPYCKRVKDPNQNKELGRLFGPSGIRGRASDHVFDATVTFRVASDDTEVAILSPVWVPRVGDLPVPN